MKYLSIIWLVVNFPISILLWHFIYKHISKKPILSITVVDLIYKDIIIYMNSLCIFYSAAVIHTLLLPDEDLNFEWACFYSFGINLSVTSICASLIFSGGLRLISLIKNSEAYGIQLLGQESVAIVKIRLMTIAISTFFPTFSFGYLRVMPGIFNTFHGEQNESIVKDIRNNLYNSIHILMPLLALIVNASARVYSYKINRQMEDEISVFVVFGNPSSNNYKQEDKFSFSLGSVLAIPFVFFFSLLIAFSSRHERLVLFGPFQITVLSVAVPIGFILSNRKMKKKLFSRFLHPISSKLNSFKKPFSSTVTPAIQCTFSKCWKTKILSIVFAIYIYFYFLEVFTINVLFVKCFW